MDVGTRAIVSKDGLQTLIDALASAGYEVLGPTVHEGAIVYGPVAHIGQLPSGWTDRQEGGRYRLERRSDDALFGYAVGPQSWKRFLHPPLERLWQARRQGTEFIIDMPASPAAPRYAFLGVRACELAAIAIQDRVFCDGPWRDGPYGQRRQDNFIVALNCSEAGGTCFCVSMQTGPRAERGFDLGLTELLRDTHEFLVEVGSARGARIAAQLPARAATEADLADARSVVERTVAHMGRRLQTDGIKSLLQGNPEHARWDQVAERCLSCGNCTLVCPTCFCTTVEDHTELSGDVAVRERRWDSCFTLDFSYLHGGSVRAQTRSRYRQWLTHKLANWIDQFGSSGCVGCGRCITWCPVGIDITEEVAAIRATAAEVSDGGS